ncbi:uncharacterized protein LOC126326596 [Schistocerca gregaria]|uniref:uncharacterized protein LOC126326596 n=1 Tax=Schistocerca gregaria TaxID=7010 RepID=UPI00211E84D5|nr:uncharacterized protein LOC126326596 [Schistocerca gregaria]
MYLLLSCSPCCHPIRSALTTFDRNISHNNISGNILCPDYVLKHTFLIDLDLSHNQFSGTICNKIFNFVSMEICDLSNNQFTSIDPMPTTKLSLKYFDLSNNQLSGDMPSISNLNKLQYLYVSFYFLIIHINNADNNWNSNNCISNLQQKFIPQ